jgi:hypothetical protein
MAPDPLKPLEQRGFALPIGCRVPPGRLGHDRVAV